MPASTMWGVHAGATGDADTLFLQQKVVAIGWTPFGDLSQCHTRDEYKKRYAKLYPQAKPQGVATSAGQLFRFVREMQVGDLIVYSSRVTREVHLGRVTGPYQYRPDAHSGYPNRRPVEWLAVVPRTQFTQGALFELGSAMSLFQIKTFADEFRAVLAGPVPTPAAEVEADTTVAQVTAEIEEQTRDFVLKRLSQHLKGIPLEEFVRHLLEVMGYRARLTPPNEPSVDVIAHKDELGFEPPIIKVQVKSGEGKVVDMEVSALLGKLGPQEYGLLVTLGAFTPPAMQFAANQSRLRLISGIELVDFIFQHYERFDSRYKSLLPLKRVYVPEVIAEDE
jgi:restriction system protein